MTGNLKKFVRRWLPYLILAVVSFLVVAAPAIAQSGTDTLQTTFDNMQESQQFWDDLWRDTFTPSQTGTQISSYLMTNLARKILAFALIFWIFMFGNSIARSSGTPDLMPMLGRFLLPVIIVSLFLSNNAANAGHLAYGMREVINQTRNGFLELQIQDVKIREAMTDLFVTKAVSDQIAEQAQYCAQMPRPNVLLPSPTRPENPEIPLTDQQIQAYNYLECLEGLERFATEAQQRASARYCGNVGSISGACRQLYRFGEKTGNSIRDFFSSETEKLTGGDVSSLANIDGTIGRATVDYLVGLGAGSAFEEILGFTQWIWVNTLELALWLSALGAPICIAMSLVPGRMNVTVSWIFGYLTIALAQVGYIIIVGAVAVMLSKTETYQASDLRFPLALGLFAPGVSLALFTGGMLAAGKSFTGQSVAATTTAISIAAGIAISAGNIMAGLKDKRR